MDEGAVIERGLRAGLKELGLECSEKQISALYGFHAYLMETNEFMNLTGHKDAKLSLVNNLFNALGPWRQVHPTKSTVDIGSGGGFPGLPLAIALDMPRVTLVDSKHKKCKFLREACKRFAPWVRVTCSDANEIRDRFQQVMFCGFGTLEKLISVSRGCLATDGRILAWKGGRDRTMIEIHECPPGYQRWDDIPFTVPGLDAERRLAVWKRQR